MTDANMRRAPEDGERTGANVDPVNINPRGRFWWAILAVYLLLFASTGYLAFFAPDVNPALAPGMDKVVAALPDDATRTFVLNALQEEEADHKKKTDLAVQSFNIVLGSLLGFLSASAVSGGSRNDSS